MMATICGEESCQANIYMHAKRVQMYTGKSHISLDIHAVWLESLPFVCTI